MWKEIESVFDEIVEVQQKKVLKSARKIIPTLTTDDILQPNDYPELENDPLFRYEEGVLEGVMTVATALRALKNEHRENSHDRQR